MNQTAITFALPKGRILEEITREFNAHGVACAFDDRLLIAENKQLGIRWLSVKNIDVPIYVHNGIAKLGIVGSDILGEYTFPLTKLHRFTFGAAKLALITTIDNAKNDLYNGATIATKYPVAAREYLHRIGVEARLIKLNGSLELAPLLGLAPYIIDIVQTGTTIRQHNLTICAEIANTSILLIANRSYYKLYHQDVDNLIDRLTKK